MSASISKAIVDAAVAHALQLKLCFRTGPDQSRHVPFTFTPCPISAATLAQLERVAPLLGTLTQAVASRDDLIEAVHAPLTRGDAFFAAMLACHRELHGAPDRLLRVPLLLQRSDFMIDQQLGPRLVECNSIAAGMAPFGDRAHSLHHYIQLQWPAEFAQYHSATAGELLANPATANMATAIASAAHRMAAELDDSGEPGFLMVVQEDEDNVFDQHLLEEALQARGVRTYRRSFRQLHQQLSTGAKQSLQLEACGTIHVVYLRAGYQYSDYVASDLDTRQCCDALLATRMFIERHRVAVNATVAQQLATSKRMQMHLTRGGNVLLAELGFTGAEQRALSAVFAQMRAVNADTAQQLRAEGNSADWVLKNQGEGGGHCLFDESVLQRLDTLGSDDYDAWVLMQRLRPLERETPTLLVRAGQAQQIDNLVSEIGLFSAHLATHALPTGDHRPGHIGYLVRSKAADVTETGIHSGYGALDSLFLEH